MIRGTDPRDDLLRRALTIPRARGGAEHPDPELVVALAADELPPEYALALTKHLAICEDGRCNAILRDVIAGAAVARDALYGARREEPTDVSFSAARQSARTFECADALWEQFAALAEEEGSGIDWLINEAMKAYARERARPVAPTTVTFKEASLSPLRERNTPTIQRSYLPKAPPSSRRSPPPSSPGSSGPAPHLAVVVEGVRYEIDKERFVVGRSGPASDLAIDDPGVSRQHAVIERTGRRYYLVDMGSTNGIEFEGERIARKQIADGDRFRIGDHEIEFRLS
jgi:hypothetical protein